MGVETRRWPAVMTVFALLVVVYAWSGAAVAAPSACLSDESVPQGASRVFYDSTSTMTPEAVTQLPATAYRNFRPGSYMGNDEGAWWLRLTVHNNSQKSCERWLMIAPPRVSDVRVYVRRDGGWQQMAAGAAHPLDQWPLKERQPMFPLHLQPGTTIVLAQVISSGQTLALTPQLWSPQRFLQQLNARSTTEGLVAGAIALLVLVSLALAYLYWRPPLLYMALATGLYAVHEAMLRNYLFVNFWPHSPSFDHWARLFVMGMHFVAFFAYLYTVVRIDRLSRPFAAVFHAALVAFGVLAVFGGFLRHEAIYSYAVIGLYQGFVWLLAVVVVFNLVSGRDRHWFAPLLIGAICLRGIVFFGQLVGLHVTFWGASYIAAPMVLILTVFLFGTMLSQARKGRRAELRARASLDAQRATENDRLERTVALRTEELNHALQARRQLLGRISHDLRAPLSGVVNSVRQWRAGDTRRDYPQLIERHVSQQMDMIDELLEFSHVEAAELQPEPIPGYLHAFVNEVADQAELTAEHHGNRLERAFADNLPALVHADFHYLQRVLINLLGNACKFTKHGVVWFVVEAKPVVSEHNACLHFIVDDEGPGIAPTDRERLLQPFARGSNAAGQQGHGLGLAIVTQLLERLGGQLQIDEAPGGGSRFHFDLVLAIASESELEPVMEEGNALAQMPADLDARGRTVLVVDDDPQQRAVTSDLLDGYGFDSVTAGRGDVALTIMQTRAIDLVLADQHMDGLDGWGLLRAIRRHHAGTPVLLYSSTPPQPPAEVEDEFDATMLKPANSALLLRKIAGLLGI